MSDGGMCVQKKCSLLAADMMIEGRMVAGSLSPIASDDQKRGILLRLISKKICTILLFSQNFFCLHKSSSDFTKSSSDFTKLLLPPQNFLQHVQYVGFIGAKR